MKSLLFVLVVGCSAVFASEDCGCGAKREIKAEPCAKDFKEVKVHNPCHSSTPWRFAGVIKNCFVHTVAGPIGSGLRGDVYIKTEYQEGK